MTATQQVGAAPRRERDAAGSGKRRPRPPGSGFSRYPK